MDGGHIAYRAGQELSAADPFPTPKGLCNKDQGCEERATLGFKAESLWDSFSRSRSRNALAASASCHRSTPVPGRSSGDKQTSISNSVSVHNADPCCARGRGMPLGFHIFIPEGCLIIVQRFNLKNSYTVTKSCKMPNKSHFSFATLYKTEFFPLLRFWQAQSFNLPRCIQENPSVMIILGQLQNVATSMLGQFCGQGQELVANRFHGYPGVFLGQTQTLKPMNQIVGQQEQLQKSYVGHPLLRRNFVQRERMEQLADGSLHVGARLISFPNSPRLQIEIGHKDRIGVAADLQQSQLLGLLRVFRQRPSHHHDPMLGLPSARLKTKFRCRPTEGHFLQAGSVGHRQVGLRLEGNVLRLGGSGISF